MPWRVFCPSRIRDPRSVGSSSVSLDGRGIKETHTRSSACSHTETKSESILFFVIARNVAHLAGSRTRNDDDDAAAAAVK